MEKKDVMLTSWLFDESYTDANISSAVMSHMQSWEIEEKETCVVRQNAANMVSGLNIANVESLTYLPHSLQLIIKDGVLLQPAVVQLLNCARSMVGHYYHSNLALNTFQTNSIATKSSSTWTDPRCCLTLEQFILYA